MKLYYVKLLGIEVYMNYDILKITAVALFLSIGSLIACPFTFVNDGLANVFISNQGKQAGTLIKAGTTKKLEGAVAAQLEVYVEKSKGSGDFDLRYLIVEEECVQKDEPLPILHFSELFEMMNHKKKAGGLIIVDPATPFGYREFEQSNILPNEDEK